MVGNAFIRRRYEGKRVPVFQGYRTMTRVDPVFGRESFNFVNFVVRDFRVNPKVQYVALVTR